MNKKKLTEIKEIKLPPDPETKIFEYDPTQTYTLKWTDTFSELENVDLPTNTGHYSDMPYLTYTPYSTSTHYSIPNELFKLTYTPQNLPDFSINTDPLPAYPLINDQINISLCEILNTLNDVLAGVNIAPQFVYSVDTDTYTIEMQIRLGFGVSACLHTWRQTYNRVVVEAFIEAKILTDALYDELSTLISQLLTEKLEEGKSKLLEKRNNI